jgi:hypothetical protein
MSCHRQFWRTLLMGLLVLACSTCLAFPAPSTAAAFTGQPARSASFASAPRTYVIRRQGNDSNCDYIAVSNGIQNIGGDGDNAFWAARALVPQGGVDYREGFYTLLGPNGSDGPFSLNNLGAAPEAFVGAYQAMGYNAVLMGTRPGTVDLAFAQAIYARLAANPNGAFVHLWITPKAYNPRARTIQLETTAERVDLLYPYHEVAAIAAPDQSNQVMILDGLVGRPYAISLQKLASLMRGFNRVIVVSRNDGDLQDHQRFQLSQNGQPYVLPALGGAYLSAARQLWGAEYAGWGRPLEQPVRVVDGSGEKIVLPGMFVHYERIGDSVTLAPLGVRMADDLIQNGVLASGMNQPLGAYALINGMRAWAEQSFGTVENFTRIYGQPLTGEFSLTADQLRWVVLRGLAYAPVERASPDGFTALLTERAMLVWNSQSGTFMLPLGQIYTQQLRQDLGI